MEKRVLLGWSASHIHSLGNTLYQSPQASMSHSGSLGRVLPSMKHRQSFSRWYTWTEFVQNEHKQSHFSLCQKSGGQVPGKCCMLSHSQGDNTSFVRLFEVGHKAATLYQLAGGNARAGFGSSRVSTYHGPHIGHQICVAGFTSPFAGRWLMHWAHSKCGLKILQ